MKRKKRVKVYGPSMRERVRSGELSVLNATNLAPDASADTKRKWALAEAARKPQTHSSDFLGRLKRFFAASLLLPLFSCGFISWERVGRDAKPAPDSCLTNGVKCACEFTPHPTHPQLLPGSYACRQGS